MKKFKITTLTLLIGLCSTSMAFASEVNSSNINNPESFKNTQLITNVNDINFMDNLIEKNGRATSFPWGNSWTLNNGSYNYSISSFNTKIGTNYYFKTTSGKINVSTYFTPTSGTNINNLNVVLYNGSSLVSSVRVSGDGFGGVTFTGLNSSGNYWISFEKANDGVWLRGSGTISQ
ncbi:hypothetical protein [Clostridium senegalense]|uniref:Uncharacterized protein n=1 Tax=Clostridium senegalense TaxID=1465809 RepID=A0A6M0GZA9_9CLOT|nr:hypothetical protein [Clostridium senegalense]NEU03527.1 hypothetical protein [Clostridium senegalense]